MYDYRYLLIGVSFYIQLLFFGGIILLYITKHMFVNAFEESFEYFSKNRGILLNLVFEK